MSSLSPISAFDNSQGSHSRQKFGLKCNSQDCALVAAAWCSKLERVIGRDGITLVEEWSNGPSRLHGHSTRSFPSCFFVGNTQTGLSPDFLPVTGFQAEHIGYIIQRCREQNVRIIEPTLEAEDAWVRTILEKGKHRRAFRQQCTPGYYNNEGETSEVLERKAAYGGGALEWMDLMRKRREDGGLEGMEMLKW